MTEPSWQSAHDANVPSAQDQHVIDTLTAVAKSTTSSASILPRAFRVLRDAQQGTAAAQSFDVIGGKASRTWCWEHEQDHRVCTIDGRLYCRPETVTVNDPAGEAALVKDHASAAQKDIRRKADRLKRAAEELASAIEDAAPRQRPPTDRDRRTAAADNTPGCASCSRIDGHSLGVPYWSPIARPATTANGNLTEPIDACSWCYRWTLDTGQLPSLAELRSHRDGVKVKRPA